MPMPMRAAFADQSGCPLDCMREWTSTVIEPRACVKPQVLRNRDVVQALMVDELGRVRWLLLPLHGTTGRRQ